MYKHKILLFTLQASRYENE